MSLRVGPAMVAVLAYVRDHPGCRKADAARYARPGVELRTGYAAVDRCIAAGLLVITRVPGPPAGAGALELSPRGRSVLALGEGGESHG